ncbi:Ectoine hydroxylase-related dioxygenase, phytanoyl-CoA dioxygenase (PhyH) family [Pedobacter steynii]|uniref:Ectoine hydroxylase-related dioxygenase, phytanoyl-CoA dioxygenase (PhyH) family n=1 Tax=Pedobacter steynii TaxID=430522 RepID=A0A1H0J2C2_9SPHI|nr:phytanoyl-CoA dioxygenase family protein [Pedobacter steynii]NQX43008.1 phytanoyl-CoA dioxygenase family protein [Pedobacter steynii]SDO37752.1 Ectoine hydroxylase-related dioxygenase, phytanoyl-CoA dioxygenase (PhyH) family [Pedobacter steynii]
MENLNFSKDLADYSHPLGDMFVQPKSAKEWEPYLLSEEQIASFKKVGFVKGIKILSEEQVDLLNAELVKLQSLNEEEKKLFYHYESNESEDPDKVLFHAIGAWRLTPGFHDLLWAPAFRMAAYQLLGQSFRIFHDQLFCKPAKHGGVVAWHQDFSYWTFTKPMHHLTCWIGLDDANEENGCLYFVPGSHKWGLLPITGLTGDMDSVRTILNEEQLAAFEKRVPNELPKGFASFHHPLTMHGSYANVSARPRRATVLNVMSAHTLGNTEGYQRLEALKTFPAMPQDQVLDSNFFPLLFDGDKELEAMGKAIPKVGHQELYDTDVK